MNPEQKLCLSWPFTIVTEESHIHLIAGEDIRYTILAPKAKEWATSYLEGFDGSLSMAEIMKQVSSLFQTHAWQLAERLYGERVLIDTTAKQVHQEVSYSKAICGESAWAKRLLAQEFSQSETSISLLYQDSLDYDEAMKWNEQQLKGKTPWIWVSCGPGTRGYVSPVFFKDVGPCFACLLSVFQDRSPMPHLYEALIQHKQEGKWINPIPFPQAAMTMLEQIAHWKIEELGKPDPAYAIYQLHVLELDTFTTTNHEVFIYPGCSACKGRRW